MFTYLIETHQLGNSPKNIKISYVNYRPSGSNNLLQLCYLTNLIIFLNSFSYSFIMIIYLVVLYQLCKLAKYGLISLNNCIYFCVILAKHGCCSTFILEIDLKYQNNTHTQTRSQTYTIKLHYTTHTTHKHLMLVAILQFIYKYIYFLHQHIKIILNYG